MDLEERRDGKIMGRMGEGKPVEMHRKQKKINDLVRQIKLERD